jgi:1-aminocyclopropane-1-carboxylate deaminase/D-cysteine desulfhydrase-like pyridoxal-dependent ACC family enzyme
MFDNTLSIPLTTLQQALFQEKKISLQLLRLDQTDILISGNKWFKLKYNLLEAQKQGAKTLLSFGGAYSNHLHALAFAGKQNHFNTIGIIRGEPYLPLNPTLTDITEQGMKLYYINRQDYRHKHSPDIIKKITQLLITDDPFNQGALAGQFYLIPEGGTNQLALLGTAEITELIPHQTDYICVPCGTGGTIAGIILGSHHLHAKILGFPAMKGGHFLNTHITQLINHTPLKKHSQLCSWQLINDWHFGGFGKINKSLAHFMTHFERTQNIALDPIYTAKMMYGIIQLIEQDYFPQGSRIIALHTGGLQGKRGMQKKINTLLY